jgi:hypothetical protein
MADWANLNFQARLHAANEPGFLAVRHLELVALNGGHLGFCLNLGINLATPAGREAASFHAALIMFCWELCSMGIGHLPYHPAPHNIGPQGPLVADPQVVPEMVAPQAPDVDHDFVEVVGGVHPIHGPWVVDHDFVEIIGGFDPVHGPWVEGPEQAVVNEQLVEEPEQVAVNEQLIEDILAEGPMNIPDWDLDFDFNPDLMF